jgi:hypothetical protein
MATAEPTGGTLTLAGGLLDTPFGPLISPAQAGNIVSLPSAQRFFSGNGGGNLYIGSGGLFMTLPAYNKIIQLIKHEGVFYDTSGVLNRLIHAEDITLVTTPVVDNLLETNQKENICKLNGVNVSRFCMGGITVGPSVQTSDGNEFQWEPVANIPGPGNYTSTLPTNYYPVDGFTWNGAGGTYHIEFPTKNTTYVSATMDAAGPMGTLFSQTAMTILTNELVLPGSNSPFVPFQG